jgi:hypothetical protein
MRLALFFVQVVLRIALHFIPSSSPATGTEGGSSNTSCLDPSPQA